MGFDLKHSLTEQLDWHWGAYVLPSLAGLTDEEYLWEPAPGCWSLRHEDGRWHVEAKRPAPDPPPLTTIAWRIAHIVGVLGGRASHHFGDGSFDGSEWTGTADGAIAILDGAYRAWHSALEVMPHERLMESSAGPPGTMDFQFPFADVILHVNREVIHHAAEVALLRDLYRVTRPKDPVVAAILAGDQGALDALLADEPGAVDRVKSDRPEFAPEAGGGANVHRAV